MDEKKAAVADEIEWETHQLQKYSLEQIQDAFAKALHELTSKPYSVHISWVNRHPKGEPLSHLSDIVDMKLRLRADLGPSPF